MNVYGVYASRWPLGRDTVWTIVNRNEYDVNTRQMSVPAQRDMRYFDVYHGVELKPEIEGNRAVLSFALEAHGHGAILATPGEPNERVRRLLAIMKSMTAAPLSNFSAEWHPLPQKLGRYSDESARQHPQGMVKIPGGTFVFQVQGIGIEGFDDVGVDVQYPWEDTP